MEVGYIFDEHLRGVPVEIIVRHAMGMGFELDLLQVGELPELPTGAHDRDILQWAEVHDRIIVSLDRSTMINHFNEHLRAGGHCPGLFFVRSATPAAIAEHLVLVAYATDSAQWRDRVEFIPWRTAGG